MTICPHDDFDAATTINKIIDTDGAPPRFMLEVTLECKDCKTGFMFPGVERVGVSWTAPAVDVSRRELRIPVAPWDGMVASKSTAEMPPLSAYEWGPPTIPPDSIRAIKDNVPLDDRGIAFEDMLESFESTFRAIPVEQVQAVGWWLLQHQGPDDNSVQAQDFGRDPALMLALSTLLAARLRKASEPDEIPAWSKEVSADLAEMLDLLADGSAEGLDLWIGELGN